jgi:pre-mRNA-splicing factor CWC26
MPSSKLDYLSKYATGKKSKKNKSKRSLYVDEDGDDFIPDSVDGLDGDGPTIIMTDASKALNALPNGPHLESISRWDGVEAEVKQKKRKKEKKKEKGRQYESDDFKIKKARLSRYDSDDASANDGKRREIEDTPKRYSGDEGREPRNKRKRYDSDDEFQLGSEEDRTIEHKHRDKSTVSNSGRRRKRYDSDDGDSRDCKVASRSHDSDDSSLSKPRKMTSGHSAGLQSSDSFRKTEDKIRQKKRNGGEVVERGETVYRNKDGREMPVDATASQINYDDKDSDPLWNLGAAQIRKIVEMSEERRKMSEGKFLTSTHDVDSYKRNIMRSGDPMARKSKGNGHKKIYKGPQPKPNRFGIVPGYRWDGIERGNGFEDQVLAAMYAKGRKNEERYKWSCADM